MRRSLHSYCCNAIRTTQDWWRIIVFVDWMLFVNCIAAFWPWPLWSKRTQYWKERRWIGALIGTRPTHPLHLFESHSEATIHSLRLLFMLVQPWTLPLRSLKLNIILVYVPRIIECQFYTHKHLLAKIKGPVFRFAFALAWERKLLSDFDRLKFES